MLLQSVSGEPRTVKTATTSLHFIVEQGRDGKTYKRASYACVNFFLGFVKYVPNFTLFCCKSELCRDFSFFLGINYDF